MVLVSFSVATEVMKYLQIYVLELDCGSEWIKWEGAKSAFNEDFILEVYGRAGFWAGGLASTE